MRPNSFRPESDRARKLKHRNYASSVFLPVLRLGKILFIFLLPSVKHAILPSMSQPRQRKTCRIWDFRAGNFSPAISAYSPSACDQTRTKTSSEVKWKFWMHASKRTAHFNAVFKPVIRPIFLQTLEHRR